MSPLLVRNIFKILSGVLCSCVLHINPATAQLCSGSLGDPVMKIDFGTDYVPALPWGVTSYEFIHDCPKKGQYTIHHLLFGCTDLFLLAGDHTYNTNGNYLLVNAENTPGLVYKTTATGL